MKCEDEALVAWYWSRKLQCIGKSLSQCHFVHYVFHMGWPGTKT